LQYEESENIRTSYSSICENWHFNTFCEGALKRRYEEWLALRVRILPSPVKIGKEKAKEERGQK